MNIATFPIDAFWSVTEQWANQAQELLPRLFAADLPEAASAWGRTQEEERPYEMRGSTAILSLSGALTKQLSWMSYYYGGTSTVQFCKTLQAALDDVAVTQICLLIDSPGGQVAGTCAAAMAIAAADQVKPVVGYVSDLCASAAYWIGSQCRALYGNSTAMVGSIGTYMTILDTSKAAKESGFKVYVIKDGDYKGMGASGTEVTQEQLQEWGRIVKDLNAEFKAGVASGRRIQPEQVATLADGRVHIGQAAVDLGLLDGICTMDECLTGLATGAVISKNPTAALSRGKERTTMNWKERLKGFVAALKSGTDLTAAEAAELEAAEKALAAGDTPTSAALIPGVTTLRPVAAAQDNATLAALEKVTATMAAQNELIAEMRQELAGQKASAAYQAHEAEINSLVRQMKMTPAQAETWKETAKANPAAFEAALPALKQSPVLAQLRNSGKRLTPTTGDTASRLNALTTARMKETKEDYASAMSAVCRENPDLAEEHKASAPVLGAEGGRN